MKTRIDTTSASRVLAALMALGALAAGCEEEPTPIQLTNFGGGPGAIDPTPSPEPPEPIVLQPPRDVCNEGTIRCRATGSPEIEVCRVPEGASAAVTRWAPDRCPQTEGAPPQVCNQGQCQDFSCTPGRFACESDRQRGLCNAEGDGLEGVEDCQGDQVCRGGACQDLCEAAANERSYIGCNYLVVDLPNPLTLEGSRGSPFGLVVANTNELQSVRLQVRRTSDGEPERLVGQATIAGLDRDNNPEGTPVSVLSTIRDAKGRVVARPTGEAEGLEVPPGGIATLLLPRQMIPFEASGIYDLSWQLKSSLPVVAYQFNPYCCNFSFTNDASLLLPIEALGTEYTAVGAADWDPGIEGIDALGMGATIVASQDGTAVEVALPPTARLHPSTSERLTIPAARSDEPTTLSVVLDRGEVMHLESHSGEDRRSELSGARITASAPVAVFSTHVCTFIPHSLAACDHLEEQLIPRDTWGSQYVLAPPARRSEMPTEVTYWRLTAGDKETRVQLTQGFDELFLRAPFASTILDCRRLRASSTNNRAFVMPPGSDCMLASEHPIALETTQPVMITGYLSGEFATTNARKAGTGDPSMFLMPPVSQFRSSYLFLTPETYASDFVTLILPREAVGSVTLDGLPVDTTDPAIKGQGVAGSLYVAMHVPVGDGAHHIECTAPFGLLVYAYDQFVSYAYTGGLNLTKRP